MSLKNIFILFLFAAFPVLFISCSDTPTDVGSGLLNQDLINVKYFDSKVDSSTIETSYFQRPVSLGTSTTILLGKKGNVEAGILVRFAYSFNDTLKRQINDDTVTVYSGWIEMQRRYTFGTPSDPLDIEVHKVNSTWTTAGFNSDSAASLQYDPQNSCLTYQVTDSLTRIDLSQSLVNFWIKSAADTINDQDNGAYLKPGPASAKINGYYALGAEESIVPILYVVYQKSDGDLDTLGYSSFADLGFVTGTPPAVSPQNMVVQAGLEVISKLKFDISSIPVNAIINKAELTLKKDTLETMVGSNYTDGLIAFLNVDSINVDSLTRSVVLKAADSSTYKGDITYFVQEWVRKNNNEGLLLFSSNRYNGVEIIALKGAGAPAADRPRLTITYTVKQ